MPKRQHQFKPNNRKERRKNERAVVKALAAGAPQQQDDYDRYARDSDSRLWKARSKLLVHSLQNQIERKVKALEAYFPPLTPKSVEELKLEKKNQNLERKYKLKGAARPATEVFPELYPELEEVKKKEEEEHLKMQRNLLNEFAHNLFSNQETRVLVWLRLQLGYAQLANGNDAIGTFKQVLTDDPSDPLGARCGLILALLDQADTEEAKNSLLECKLEYAEVKWNRVLIEYILFIVLKESPNEEELIIAINEANSTNPYIGHLLAAHDKVTEKLDPNVVDSCVRQFREDNMKLDLPSTSIGRCDGGICQSNFSGMEYAIAYFVSHVSLWRDAEGACEWIKSHVRLVPRLKDNGHDDGNNSDSAFLVLKRAWKDCMGS